MIVAGFLIVNGPSQGGVRGVLVRAESSDRYRNYALDFSVPIAILY